MDSDLLEVESSRARRTWLFSPAIATGIFFAAQLFVTLAEDRSSTLHAAAADTPSATPVQVRVVTQIKSFQELSRARTRVPASEGELLELLDKRGCVVFSPQEVDKIGTLEASFEAGEVGVITADTPLRRATFRR